MLNGSPTISVNFEPEIAIFVTFVREYNPKCNLLSNTFLILLKWEKKFGWFNFLKLKIDF